MAPGAHGVRQVVGLGAAATGEVGCLLMSLAPFRRHAWLYELNLSKRAGFLMINSQIIFVNFILEGLDLLLTVFNYRLDRKASWSVLVRSSNCEIFFKSLGFLICRFAFDIIGLTIKNVVTGLTVENAKTFGRFILFHDDHRDVLIHRILRHLFHQGQLPEIWNTGSPALRLRGSFNVMLGFLLDDVIEMKCRKWIWFRIA